MSWEQLQAIIKQNREIRNDEQRAAPVACPIDGSVLDIHANGSRNCPLGNYRFM